MYLVLSEPIQVELEDGDSKLIFVFDSFLQKNTKCARIVA